MVVNTILTLVVIVNGAFAIMFVRDLMSNKDKLKEEKGNPLLMSASQFLIYLFSTFGISDFAIGASLYPKMKWVGTKNLPGTLNTACVIPVAVMALVYISNIEVGLPTLITAIVAQVLGAFIAPRYVVKLPVKVIKIFVSIGLLVAAATILAGKFGVFPSGGDATELSGGMLVLFAILCFIYGGLNNIGIGSYALTMATTYAMGLNPAVAFPIMMGACTFSVPVGSMQFIKLDSYSRKITLFSATFGVVGVLIAAYVVKSLDVSMLQWLVTAVIIYSAITLLMGLSKED